MNYFVDIDYIEDPQEIEELQTFCSLVAGFEMEILKESGCNGQPIVRLFGSTEDDLRKVLVDFTYELPGQHILELQHRRI
jgi:hypothetical protein